MHGGDNPRSVSSNSVCHQTENTWAELREPCAKLIWYQAYGCGSFLFVFLQRGLKSSIRICCCPLQACSQFLWSPSTFFTSKLSCYLSSLSNRPPNSSGFVPFSPAHPSPALQTGRLVCPLILCGLLSFPDTSGSPAGPVPSLPTPDLPQKKYIHHCFRVMFLCEIGCFICWKTGYIFPVLILVFSFSPPSLLLLMALTVSECGS